MPDELKERVYEANMELARKNLVVYTFGNASGIDRDRGIVAIKPSGVPYGELTPESMVLVGLDNTVIEGNFKPSSDTKTHTLLYRNFPKIGGVAHTHSPNATAWAQAMLPIPCLGTTHADHLPGDIPCTRVMPMSRLRGITRRKRDVRSSSVSPASLTKLLRWFLWRATALSPGEQLRKRRSITA